jgi:hypothetical protein
MYANSVNPEVSYHSLELLSGGTTKVFSDDYSDDVYRVDLLIFESGITYISANSRCMQEWMFRGDLDHFPQIQFIALPILINGVNFVYYAIDDIMKTFSYANQILLSRHFSISKYLNVVTEESTIKDNQDDFKTAIYNWFKTNALSIDRMQKLPDPDFIFNLTRVTGFVTLTSKVIEKEVLENKLLSLKNNNEDNPYGISNFEKYQDGMIEYINQTNTNHINEKKVFLHTWQ